MTNFSGSGRQPPGFYRDNQGTMRWWDGSSFTERTQDSGVQHVPAIVPFRVTTKPTMRDRLISDGKWYYTLTVLTAGLFAWVPFLHASARLHDTNQRRRAATYGVLAVALGVSAGLTPSDAQGEPVGAVGAVLSTVVAVAAIAVIAVACIQLRPLRIAVYGLDDQHGVTPPTADRAVTQALAARERREKARELAERDPNLARDLNIGRPDRVRDFDDGGLVDLNSAPAEVLTTLCGFSKDTAERVVAARQQWGSGFSSVSEVVAYVDLSERDESLLRDRGVVLPL